MYIYIYMYKYINNKYRKKYRKKYIIYTYVMYTFGNPFWYPSRRPSRSQGAAAAGLLPAARRVAGPPHGAGLSGRTKKLAGGFRGPQSLTLTPENGQHAARSEDPRSSVLPC